MAIELIEEFIIDAKDFTLYDQDRKTQSAVERQLAIIGEALNQFQKLEPEVKIENDKQIISFRNRLVHAYDSLDNSMIWVIISKHLTPLKIEIQKLM
jgi:uncharacterized protein with HEPN domain